MASRAARWGASASWRRRGLREPAHPEPVEGRNRLDTGAADATLSAMSSVRTRNVRTASLLAWLRLVRVFQKVNRASTDSLRCRQLSPAQVDVLANVGAAEGISQQELADALLVTKGNVCQLLDKMETSGLLERRAYKRGHRLCLPAPGRP